MDPHFKFTMYAVDGALPSSSQHTPWMEPSLQFHIYTPRMETYLQVHNICHGWSPPFKFTIYAVDGALSLSSHIYAVNGALP
jgi:hypothetical protein